MNFLLCILEYLANRKTYLVNTGYTDGGICQSICLFDFMIEVMDYFKSS